MAHSHSISDRSGQEDFRGKVTGAGIRKTKNLLRLGSNHAAPTLRNIKSRLWLQKRMAAGFELSSRIPATGIVHTSCLVTGMGHVISREKGRLPRA
jgi:hypothetical protein